MFAYVFVGTFLAIVAIIGGAVLVALWKARGDVVGGRAASMGWAEEFRALPESDRACRHELTGEIAHRVCPNGFDCRVCEVHPKFGTREPADLFFHRGHTWVRPLDDGTVVVGLDDLVSRLLGTPDRVALPSPGTRLEVNGTGWTVYHDGVDVRVMSPVDGIVTEIGDASKGWYLKVRPPGDSLDDRHLLRGAEARAWMAREIERLQGLVGNGQAGPTLADGGVLIQDLAGALPAGRRDAIVAEMMMDG